jgi:simple sugar transport system substrate-binding protein
MPLAAGPSVERSLRRLIQGGVMAKTRTLHTRERGARAAAALAACALAWGCQGPSSSSGPAGSAAPGGSAAPAASAGAGQRAAFTVGLVLVGPWNDKGWNQAHYEGMKDAIAKVPGTRFDYVDKVNPSDRPNVKGAQVGDDLISRGARLVVFNSDDYADDALETARKHPDVAVIHVSGDYAWKEGKNYKGQPNLGNLMGRVEAGAMIAGCAAALGTEAGKIGYLGPLVNDETRRLVSAAYLGARHCWEKYRKKKPEELTFKVTWIGFWFNLPGVTLDPTKVADDFYNGGFDIVMTGLDTPEEAVQAKKAAEAGKKIRYLHYDYKGGCEIAPDLCLGVSYYNWTPPYVDAIRKAQGGKFVGEFLLLEPDFKDMNGEGSLIGFLPGKALGERKAELDEVIKALGDGSLNLYTGPIKFQDGTDFLKAGEVATPQQIWYMPKLVAGIDGPSK